MTLIIPDTLTPHAVAAYAEAAYKAGRDGGRYDLPANAPEHVVELCEREFYLGRKHAIGTGEGRSPGYRTRPLGPVEVTRG